MASPDSLTAAELRIAECTGMAPEQFAKALQEDARKAALSALQPQPTLAQVFARCGLQPPEDAQPVAQCSYSVAALSAQPDGRVVAADMAHGESRIVRVARLVIIGGNQRTQAGVCETASLLRRERAVCD